MEFELGHNQSLVQRIQDRRLCSAWPEEILFLIYGNTSNTLFSERKSGNPTIHIYEEQVMMPESYQIYSSKKKIENGNVKFV